MQEENIVKARIRKNSKDATLTGGNFRSGDPQQNISPVFGYEGQPQSFNYRVQYYRMNEPDSKLADRRTMENYHNQCKYFSAQRKQIIKQTQKIRDKSKQRVSNLRSSLFIEGPQLRLPTDELIPSFRQKYQIYQLLQQISDNKRTIQLKNKQIFYLSNQIVSVKDQFTQKILHLQTIISQNKRELTELRYSGLKNKRMQSQKGDKLLEQLKKNYQLQIHKMKQASQQVMEKFNQQHKRQMQNLQQKYVSMLNIEKRDKLAAEELFQQKCKNLQSIIKQLQEQNDKIKKKKQQQTQQYNEIQVATDRLKQQFKQFSQRASNQQKSLKIQNQKLKSQVSKLQQNERTLKKQSKNKIQQLKDEIKQLQQSAKLNKQQINKMKQIIALKDKQIARIVEASGFYIKQKSRKKSQINIDNTRTCNHDGLIQQLQRNISIKNKQNQELRQQLKQWGKYIGFDRSCHDRTNDLLNASQQALQTQQNFSSSLRKKFNKLNS